jgi:hypothetical protein
VASLQQLLSNSSSHLPPSIGGGVDLGSFELASRRLNDYSLPSASRYAARARPRSRARHSALHDPRAIPTQSLDIRTGRCSIFPSMRITPSNERGEKGKTWSQRHPPPSEIVLDGDTDQMISASASDQLIATQLICILIVRPFVVGRAGALSGDVWIWSWGVAHVWYEWDRGVGRTDGANLR